MMKEILYQKIIENNNTMNKEELYRKLRMIQELLDEDVREAKRELEYLIQEVHNITKTR